MRANLLMFFLIISLHCIFIPYIEAKSPVIGILTQPSFLKEKDEVSLSASYVKWLESAGAIVVPIPHYESTEVIVKLMKSINGVLLMGGGLDLVDSTNNITEFQMVSEVVLNTAYLFNTQDNYFPVWGTCLGYESMVIWSTRNASTIEKCKDLNIHHNIKFTQKPSKLKDFLGPGMIKLSENHGALYFNHHDYFSPEIYENHNFFKNTFTISATSILPYKQKEMISIIEGTEYPFTGVMFHPEKNQFEHNFDINISNDFSSIRLAQDMANYFVNQARLNKHEMKDEDLDQMMIFNFPTTRSNHSYTEIYYIKKSSIYLLNNTKN